MYTEESNIYEIGIIAIAILIGMATAFVLILMRLNEYHVVSRRNDQQMQLRNQEKEREAVAADLHDELGTGFAALKMKLESVEAGDSSTRKTLNQSVLQVDSMYNQVKQIALRLMPPHLESGPLVAISDFINRYTKGFPFELSIEARVCEDLTNEQSLHLYRMLQEIINNAARHSRAKRMHIAGIIKPGYLEIKTFEDGIGLTNVNLSPRKGFGLQTLAMRAKLIGATLDVRSMEGAGTFYTISLPLYNKASV